MMILSSNSVINTLDGLRGAVVASKLAAFSALAATLAAVFAGIVLLRLAHDYVSGQGLTFWELVRPFVLFLLVARFNTFVADPLHRVVNIFSAGIERQADKGFGDYAGKVSTFLANSISQTKTEMGRHLGGGSTSSASQADGVSGSSNSSGSSIGQWFSDRARDVGNYALEKVKAFFDWIGRGVADFVTTISNMCGFGLNSSDIEQHPFLMILGLLLTGAMKLVLFAQQCQCYVLLTILTLLGPFAFALSIFQPYRSSATSWIARYISISLWIPIGQIVMFVSYKLLDMVAGMELSAGATEPLLTVCAIIVSIMCIRQVPTMTSYVVESAGSGGAENGTGIGDGMNALKAAGAKALGRR